MRAVSEVFQHFFKGIARSRVSLIGAMMVTIIFPFLGGALIYDAIWSIKNIYVGGLVYMVLGPAFIFGLVLVFLGLFFFKGKEEVHLFTLEYLRGYFTDPHKFKKMRRLVFFSVFLTCINLFIFALLAYSSYGYMESVGFCGTFCHSVMTPEYTAYSNSPHSRVPCVECHIGSGASWFVKSKISGARQLFAVALNDYPRPIPDPVTNLRPARDTCEHCHRPSKFHGDQLVVLNKYEPNKDNTHVQTVLMMKIGSGGDRVVSPMGIHWHVSPQFKIVYKTTTRDRMNIPEVIVYNKKTGTKKVFKTPNADAELKKAGSHVETRTMDCIDCHNRPTHIFLPAGQAIDKQILKGHISQSLPFIKKMALQVVKPNYKSQAAAKKAIASKLTAWYQKNYPELIKKKPDLLTQAISGVQTAYDENVFPMMNIHWGTYKSNLGHQEDLGCWRCHDSNHSTKSGETISMDCNTCHVILAQDQKDPPILKKLDPEIK